MIDLDDGQEKYYRDPTHITEKPDEITKGIVDDISRKIAQWLREKKYGRDVRESLAQAVELFSVKYYQLKALFDKTDELSKETQSRQEELENRFDTQIAGNTDISEIIDSRFSSVTKISFPTIKRRLDFSDSILFSQVPSGFKFIIEHTSEYQPDIKVTFYRNALETELDGFDTGPVFGGETIYNVPTHLSYDRHKAYIEMPLFYALNGEISQPTDNVLLIIAGNEVLCFTIKESKILKGSYPDEEPTTILRIPKALEVTAIDDTTIKLTWKRGD